MKTLLVLALVGAPLVGAAGCWCPCEVHGTTMPLPPPQQCAESKTSSQSTPGGEQGAASQPTKK